MRALVSWLGQVVTVTWFNLKNLRERLGASAVTVLGIAGVVMVFVGVLSIASGFKQTLSSTGDPASVLVLRSGSDTEMTSGLGLEETRIISDGTGVEAASAELYVILDLPKRSTGTPANVPLRGVQPEAYDVRRQFEIVEGRRFEPGRQEVIVGQAAAGQFGGLAVGDTLRVGQHDWAIVGKFSTDGTVEDTELWCDAPVLQQAYNRGASFQSVHVRLTSPDGFTAYKDGLTSDPRLNVKVIREAEYYSQQSTFMTGFIQGIGLLIGGLMGFGAVFGALNTMYSAVSSRSREIATLRALGFNTGPVVISVLVESVALALVGGVIGAGLAYLLFNGYQAATLNFQSFTQVAFAFAVTQALVLGGILYALVMGFVGGLFPAVRAARMPVASALREL